MSKLENGTPETSGALEVRALLARAGFRSPTRSFVATGTGQDRNDGTRTEDEGMQLGIIGLGKMGAGMTRRLLSGGHEMVVLDRNPGAVAAAVADGAVGARSTADLVGKLTAPRAVWVMVPSGGPTEETIAHLAEFLEPGDTVIDGGNSNYKDTLRRAVELGNKRLHAVDVGTSGGIWGIEEGYSMMVGGEAKAVARLGPIFETLAPAADKGWGRVGPSGSGHFVKMVHNGVEYGLMEAYAEGFNLMRHKEEFGLNVHQIAEIWRTGSVVRSWLLDLAALALADDADLDGVAPYVHDSGEGRWTVVEAVEMGVAIPVITSALEQRFASREAQDFGNKLLNALRNQFGGHELQRKV